MAILTQTFGHSLFRKYTAIFGSLLNEVYVKRAATDTLPEQEIKVPIRYEGKDKLLARVLEDPDANRDYAILLPRMSFEIEDVVPDPSRMQQKMAYGIVRRPGQPDSARFDYAPAPFNIVWRVVVLAKNNSDGDQIIEQILPFFKPEWSVTAELVPELGPMGTRDLDTVFNGLTRRDEIPEKFPDRRTISWTLRFTMKAFLFGPVRNKPIIKFSETHLRTSANGAQEVVRVSPGLTANGGPTSDPSEAVDPHVVYLDDDYGYVTRITDE